MIPKWEIKGIRDCLAKLYPELAEKTFRSTKLCWYADTPSGDSVIDCHPKPSNAERSSCSLEYIMSTEEAADHQADLSVVQPIIGFGECLQVLAYHWPGYP
jgi:hypothetical protein